MVSAVVVRGAVRVMVPESVSNTMESLVLLAAASAMACASEPGPELLVLLTMWVVKLPAHEVPASSTRRRVQMRFMLILV